MKLTTWSACPANFSLRSGFWVAIPTGHVSKWQTRIITQPITTSGAVANPNSSAPNSAAIITSLPVFNWPSHWTTIRSRKLFNKRVCWVSARPSSQGVPACLIEVRGDAPVPPSCPDIKTTSAWAFETPAATVPTPSSETNLTWTRASGFAFLRSCINWAKSSIEYMSWCGGGEIKSTPGVEWRTSAIHGQTLWPGSWPPSPGLAPWAILIWISSALTKYSLVTPNLPEAACLIADRRRSPFSSGVYLLESSPPSPVFDLAPIRFMAIANVSWASAEIDPYDIAPVENVFMISLAGSTSLIGIGSLTPDLNLNNPRRVARSLACSSTRFVYSLNMSYRFSCVACCNLKIVSGLNRWNSPSRRHWYSPPAIKFRWALWEGTFGKAIWCRNLISSASCAYPTPPNLLMVPGKASRISDCPKPIDSKICEPI